MERHEEILYSLYLEEQIKLSKWIIALSSGAAIFSVRLVNTDTTLFWRYELILGISSLVLSILFGVRYVTLKIEFLRHWFLQTNSLGDINRYEKLISEEERLKVVNLIEEAKIDKVEAEKNMDKIGPKTAKLYKWQHGLFYTGMILIVIFGVFSISK